MLIGEDTIVHTLRGDRRAGALADVNETVFCFAWQQDRITFGRVTAEQAGEHELHRVVLDNGKSLLMSADSVLLRRDGVQKPLMTLIEKSVMPLYLSQNTYGYPTYRQVCERRTEAPAPSDRKPWRSIARMVWENRTGRRIQPGFLVRHLDGNRRNCHPGNLKLDGHPQKKPRRNKMRSHIEAQRMTIPGNHKVLGFAPWGTEPCVRLVPADCASVAVGEIFMVTHGA
jgi:hypothetical protein